MRKIFIFSYFHGKLLQKTLENEKISSCNFKIMSSKKWNNCSQIIVVRTYKVLINNLTPKTFHCIMRKLSSILFLSLSSPLVRIENGYHFQNKFLVDLVLKLMSFDLCISRIVKIPRCVPRYCAGEARNFLQLITSVMLFENKPDRRY